MEVKKYERHALFGFIGSLIFMIGDWLLFLYPGRRINLMSDPIIEHMPLWRFIVSSWTGFIGMAFMLYGFNSLYKLVSGFAGNRMKAFATLGAIGAAGTALAHFNEGPLIPLVYKACYGMTTLEELEQICNSIRTWTAPIDIVMIGFIYVQWITLYYLVLTKKVPLARKWLLLPIITLALAGVFTMACDGTLIAGFFSAFESLSEGTIYLLVMFVWMNIAKKKMH